MTKTSLLSVVFASDDRDELLLTPGERGFLRLVPGVDERTATTSVVAPSFDCFQTEARVQIENLNPATFAERAARSGARRSRLADALLDASLEPLSQRALQVTARTNVPEGCHGLGAGLWVIPVRTPTLPPATFTNTYIAGQSDLSIVDPATPYPDEQARFMSVLDQLRRGRPVGRILLSHHHFDHIGGARALATALGVKIFAHADTLRLLPDGFPIGGEIQPAATIGTEENQLSALHTPGHAPGHLVFWHEPTRSLIAGDMVAGVGTILIDPDDEGDMGAYLRSLEALQARAPDRLLPAHGPPILDADERLRFYRDHRLLRESRVMSALAAGANTIDTLLPIVYADVDPNLFPLARKSLRAHLAKLSAEDRVVARHETYRLT